MNQYCKVTMRGEIVDDIGSDENGHYFALIKVIRASQKIFDIFMVNFASEVSEKVIAELKSGDKVMCEGVLRHWSYGRSSAGRTLKIVISKIEKDG